MSWVASTTGARISELLDGLDFNDRALWQGGITNAGTRLTGAFDTGDAITVPNVDGTKSILAIIQEMLEAERGVFYIGKDGDATYEERESRARRTTSTATLTTYALTSQPGFEYDQMVNRQAVTSQTQAGAAGTTPNTLNDGVKQVAQNAVSVKIFGVQDGQDITSQYVPGDTQALNLAQYIVNIKSSFAAPVTIQMDGGSATAITQMLSLELQDRVTVTDANSGTSGDYVIEGIEVEIGEGGNRFVTTYTMSEYGVLPFVFGSSTQGTFAPPPAGAGNTYTACTFAGRPTAPTNGDFIYETDTGRYFKRVAGAWVLQTYPRMTY